MAEFYGSLEDAAEYHLAREHDAWALSGITDGQQTAALVRASAWLDATYGTQYPGSKAGGRAQELGWPRVDAADMDGEDIADDEIPREIEQATYEAALRELTAPGSLSPDYVASERVKQEKVGDLSVTYADGAGTIQDIKPVVSVIDGILASLLRNKSTASPLFGFSERA